MKHWLKANKIWFETVAASLLSFMAVVVSCSQGRTASKQTELLAVQTRIAEAQASPQFELEIRPKLNESTAKFDDYVLVINNHGGMVEDFAAETAVFLHLETPGAGLEIHKVDIPVSGYFTASFLNSAGTGELVSMIGAHNNASVMKLANDLRDLSQRRKLDFAILSEQIIVRLRYRDLLGRRREDYYEARFVGGASRMPDDVGKAKLTAWEQASRPELSVMDAESLINSAKSSK